MSTVSGSAMPLILLPRRAAGPLVGQAEDLGDPLLHLACGADRGAGPRRRAALRALGTAPLELADGAERFGEVAALGGEPVEVASQLGLADQPGLAGDP